jgi:hypothetical protein
MGVKDRHQIAKGMRMRYERAAMIIEQVLGKEGA